MTWGSHCHQCGFESCAWVRGDNCEGRSYPYIVSTRDAYERMSWWRRVFHQRPHVTAPHRSWLSNLDASKCVNGEISASKLEVSR